MRNLHNLHRQIDNLAGREGLPWVRKGNRLKILFAPDGRSQVVRLSRRKDRFVFESIVARAKAVDMDSRSLAFRIWRRNALKSVVMFLKNSNDQVIGLIDQPIDNMHDKELKFYLETLARECDRFEYVLTGEDVW